MPQHPYPETLLQGETVLSHAIPGLVVVHLAISFPTVHVPGQPCVVEQLAPTTGLEVDFGTQHHGVVAGQEVFIANDVQRLVKFEALGRQFPCCAPMVQLVDVDVGVGANAFDFPQQPYPGAVVDLQVDTVLSHTKF